MTKQELYLKTVFACMACDGDIAKEEVDLVKDLVSSTNLFGDLDVETILNGYIERVNKNGSLFLSQYLSDVAEIEMNQEDELQLVDLALKTIEADNIIEYSEVKFFKKIRARLSLSDDCILSKYPEKEDF